LESNVIILTENLMKTLSLCILFGVVCIKLGKKLPIPDVVLFIIAGIILGPQFLNIINWEDYKVGNQLILSFGAAYILYDWGKEIQLKVLNKVKFSVFTLATVGVLITTFVTGYFAYRIFNIDFIYALLLGSVIASTDPSVLVPLFKKIQISDWGRFFQRVTLLVVFALMNIYVIVGIIEAYKKAPKTIRLK